MKFSNKLLLLVYFFVSAFSSFAQKELILNNTAAKTVVVVQPLKNILFIAIDDLRNQLGCYGDSIAITPNIDNLAKKGVLFTRAYCQQAVCAPSRASLMTGRRPNTTKVWDLITHFREALPNVITLPQYFKLNGYHTQSVGKIYHDPASAQDPASWSVPETLAVTDDAGGKYALSFNLNKKGSWKAFATERADVPDSSYVDGKVSNAAVRILNEIKSRPFFLAVGFRRPHLPFSAPEKYWVLYDDKKIPMPNNPHPPTGVPEIALHNWQELRGYMDIVKTSALTGEKILQLLQGYYASTSFVDAQIGKVLDELDRLGLADNTIIILWSDHGYHLGEHNLWGKTTNFELDTRVPLIISSPGQPKLDTKSAALVELVDIYPTLTELAGLPLPKELEGISMVPLLKNPKLPWKAAVFSQFPRVIGNKDKSNVMGYSLRTQNFRYTEWQDIKSQKVYIRELYDHKQDPFETSNLVNKLPKENIKKLTAMLKGGWQKALPPKKIK